MPEQALTPTPWFTVVQPHQDIQQGRLDESVFAANLAEVSLGQSREEYQNASLFFKKTYLTQGLRNLIGRVVKGLNGGANADNRVLSLQTGFGGGKTHSLISLYHVVSLGKNEREAAAGEVLAAAGVVSSFGKAQVAVFTNTTNDAATGRKTAEGLHLRTLWGELAYQLGGVAGYELVRANDEQRTAPGGVFKKVLALCQPALILIDELADYCLKASAQGVGESNLANQTISFMQELTEAVASTDRCVAVVTLPASSQEVGNTEQATDILGSLQKRVARVGADTQPVEDDEIFEVIRKRLFEHTGPEAARNEVLSLYHQAYEQLAEDLPDHVRHPEYKARMAKAYPFHPELVDIFRIRWASDPRFQRTRGVLRLLAAIVSDLWQRRQNMAGPAQGLIHPADVRIERIEALSGQLKYLYGAGYDAVITGDVGGSSANATRIDQERQDIGQHLLAQGVAGSLLLSTFGADGARKGLNVAELKLHLLRPGGFNHNMVNTVLDHLEGRAHYLYFSELGVQGKRYWFHTKPNINILIGQAREAIAPAQREAEIIRRLEEQSRHLPPPTQGPQQPFEVLASPSAAIPEKQRPTLVLMHPRYALENGRLTAEAQGAITQLAETKGGENIRTYRNTLLFLCPTATDLLPLHKLLGNYLGGQRVLQDYGQQLDDEQRKEVRSRIEAATRELGPALIKAYTVVVRHTQTGPQMQPLNAFAPNLGQQLENIKTALASQDWLLLTGVGMGLLTNHKMAPPHDNPAWAMRTQAIYEAFMRYNDKPMLGSADILANSLASYCQRGFFALATGTEAGQYTQVYHGEQDPPPMLKVQEDTWWVVHTSVYDAHKAQEQATQASTGTTPGTAPTPYTPAASAHMPAAEAQNPYTTTPNPVPEDHANTARPLEALTISGKLNWEQWSDAYSAFINILVVQGYTPDIGLTITVKPTPDKPLPENGQLHQMLKESARQMGLTLREEGQGEG